MTTKADDIISKIEAAGASYSAAVDAETKRVTDGLKELQDRLAKSGILERAWAVLEKHTETSFDAVFMPLCWNGAGYPIGVRLDGCFAHRHEQRKSITLEEAAKTLVLDVESRFPTDAQEIDCVERYLDHVLKTIERDTRRVQAKSQPNGNWTAP